MNDRLASRSSRIVARDRARFAPEPALSVARRLARWLALSVASWLALSFTTAVEAQAIEPPALVFTIDVRWAGASSSYRLERDVTVKVEDAVKRLPGVRKVRSTASGSRSQTSVFFDTKTDASSTASTIRNQLDQIKMRLPRGASPPLIAWHREPAVDR